MVSGRKIFGLFLFALAVVASVAVIIKTFQDRYQAGDVYSPYSTFRTDPQGTSALYAALDALEGIEVKRNLDPVSAIGEGTGRCLVLAAAIDGPDTIRIAEALDKFIADGGVFFAAYMLSPYVVNSESAGREAMEEDESEEEETGEDNESEADTGDLGEEETESDTEEKSKESRVRDRLARIGQVDLADRWGFKIGRRGLPEPGRRERPVVTVKRAVDNDTLPEELDWYGAGYFTDLAEEWTPIYTWAGDPVLVERTFPSGGTIILATDQYYLSNESLSLDRESALLNWLLMRRGEVIFEETHLGNQTPSFIMSLMRRYRLQGVLAVFILLAVLYIWKNSSSLIPRAAAAVEDVGLRTRTGRESSEALHHLLRRTVPASRLLQVALKEWRNSAPKDPVTRKVGDEMAGLLTSQPARNADEILARYRELCRIASRRGRP